MFLASKIDCSNAACTVLKWKSSRKAKLFKEYWPIVDLVLHSNCSFSNLKPNLIPLLLVFTIF